MWGTMKCAPCLQIHLNMNINDEEKCQSIFCKVKKTWICKVKKYKRKCFLVVQMGINSIENGSICGLGIINDITKFDITIYEKYFRRNYFRWEKQQNQTNCFQYYGSIMWSIVHTETILYLYLNYCFQTIKQNSSYQTALLDYLSSTFNI